MKLMYFNKFLLLHTRGKLKTTMWCMSRLTFPAPMPLAMSIQVSSAGHPPGLAKPSGRWLPEPTMAH